MRRQGRPMGAQVYAMYLSDWKGWSQDPPPPSSHLSVSSEDESTLVEISAYQRLSKGKQLFFVSVSTVAVFGLVLICCS